MLEVKDLVAGVSKPSDVHTSKKMGYREPILNGISLSVANGQICALMGQNGSGKSTLAHVLMGNPAYSVSSGQVRFEGKDILSISPVERASAGIFLSFQHPKEIPGVRVSSYLRLIYNTSRNENISPAKFREYVRPLLELLQLNPSYLKRYLNDGFSGGEKKKMEMLQMLVLQPKLVILDEVDSGLDVDAIKLVANAVNHLREQSNSAFLVITHYSRILKHIKPDRVFIMESGRVVKEGSSELAFDVEEYGYGQSSN